jgi:HEAT repeat protein
MSLLLIGSSHTPLDAFCAASLQNFRLFQQPASAFSRANGVMALPQTGSRRAVPILIELLRNPNPDIGRLASIGLIHLTHRSPFEAGRWFIDPPSNEYQDWFRWWMVRGDGAPVYGPSQCGVIEHLD